VDETPALDSPTTIEHDPDSFRINLVLLDENARRDGIARVVVVHRDRALQDDRPGIESRVHEVDGHATDFHAVRERLSWSIDARKGRKQ
jgi:hypothetical protein